MCDNHYAEKKDPQWPARKGGGRGTCVRATRGSHIRRAYRTVERLKVTGPPSAFTPNCWEAGLGRAKEILSTKRAHSNPLRHGWCVSGKVLEICSLNLTAHTPSSCGDVRAHQGGIHLGAQCILQPWECNRVRVLVPPSTVSAALCREDAPPRPRN